MTNIDLSQLQDWLGKRFDAIDERLNEINNRFDTIEARLNEIEDDIIDAFNVITRLAHIDIKSRRRVDALEARLKALEEEQGK